MEYIYKVPHSHKLNITLGGMKIKFSDITLCKTE